jgi:hypothetical protein
VVVRANIAPAAQIALLTSADPASAQLLYVAVLTGALLITAAAAWTVGDGLLSLSIAATASLVLLPVAWYHYPPALIPFAIAAVVRATGTPRASIVSVLVTTAAVVASAAAALPVAVWLAVALVLAAVALSAKPVAAAIEVVA